MKVWPRVSLCLAEQGGTFGSTGSAPFVAVKKHYQVIQERSSCPWLPPSDRKSTGLRVEDGRKPFRGSHVLDFKSPIPLTPSLPLQRLAQPCLHPLHPAVMDCGKK